MEFVAIDVETANADMSSICQVGVAFYCNGQLVEEWKTYVDPEDEFDGINISIHGITEETVKDAPIISDISATLCRFLNQRVSVCHSHFDRVAIHQAFQKYNLQHPECIWLDSARVARRTWRECAQRGYGLATVCEFLGYKFTHHDALEDAKAAAHILNAAIEKTGLDVEEWLKRVNQPVDITGRVVRRDGNLDGPLFGEVIVFTGALEIPRREAANMAACVGCRVDAGVTKHTTILVVGDQDIKKLAGQEKSSKHRKAEGLISLGQPIRILRETDFKQLVDLAE